MLKIRLQGTKEDLEWYQQTIKRDPSITVLNVSKPFRNKGTTRYFRVYAEVEKKER